MLKFVFKILSDSPSTSSSISILISQRREVQIQHSTWRQLRQLRMDPRTREQISRNTFSAETISHQPGKCLHVPFPRPPLKPNANESRLNLQHVRLYPRDYNATRTENSHSTFGSKNSATTSTPAFLSNQIYPLRMSRRDWVSTARSFLCRTLSFPSRPLSLHNVAD